VPATSARAISIVSSTSVAYVFASDAPRSCQDRRSRKQFVVEAGRQQAHEQVSS